MIEPVVFVEANLGKPWIAGANGPNEYDCWGWTQAVELACFDRSLADIKEPPTRVKDLIDFVRNHSERRKWRITDKPVHGGLVQLAHNKRPFHIGVYLDIDGGGITHAVQGVGVTFDTLLSLRTAGWRGFLFHEWGGNDPGTDAA